MTTPNFRDQAYAQVATGEANAELTQAVEMDKFAAEHGFTEWTGSHDGQTFFQWGTQLNDDGAHEYQMKSKLHNELPFAKDAAAEFKAKLDSENRTTMTVPVNDIRMDKAGLIHVVGEHEGRYPLARWALAQLLARADAPGGATGVLSPKDGTELTPDLRQDVFNHYMIAAPSNKKNPRQSMLRIRSIGDHREIFAALTPSYKINDGDTLSAFLANKVPANARGSWHYDQENASWRFTVEMMDPVEPKVGDIFECRVTIKSADDGGGQIWVKAEVVRVRCRNLTTLSSVQVNSIRHNANHIQGKLNDALHYAVEVLTGFGEIWSQNSQRLIIENATDVGAENVFKMLIAKKLVAVNGVSDDVMLARLNYAWAKEPGYTYADISNAITRAANSFAWSSQEDCFTLADQGGKILYAKNVLVERDLSLLEID